MPQTKTIDELLEELGEDNFEYHPVGTTGEWRRFKAMVVQDIREAIERAGMSAGCEACWSDDYGKCMCSNQPMTASEYKTNLLRELGLENAQQGRNGVE